MVDMDGTFPERGRAEEVVVVERGTRSKEINKIMKNWYINIEVQKNT